MGNRRGELHQPCKPQSVPIRPQQHISVLGSFLEAALLNFSPRLIDLIGQLGSALSQPFLDKHFGDQALEPHNEAAVVDIHTHPQHPTTQIPTNAKNWLFLESIPLLTAPS